jgi:hypothetical protein
MDVLSAVAIKEEIKNDDKEAKEASFEMGNDVLSIHNPTRAGASNSEVICVGGTVDAPPGMGLTAPTDDPYTQAQYEKADDLHKQMMREFNEDLYDQYSMYNARLAVINPLAAASLSYTPKGLPEMARILAMGAIQGFSAKERKEGGRVPYVYKHNDYSCPGRPKPGTIGIGRGRGARTTPIPMLSVYDKEHELYKADIRAIRESRTARRRHAVRSARGWGTMVNRPYVTPTSQIVEVRPRRKRTHVWIDGVPHKLADSFIDSPMSVESAIGIIAEAVKKDTIADANVLLAMKTVREATTTTTETTNKGVAYSCMAVT